MADDTVILTPGKDANGAFQWQMGLNGSTPAGPPYPAITVAHGHTAVISFSIQNAPGVTFTDKPFLVPAETKGLHIDSLQPTELTVKDHNLGKDQIPYTLAFNGAVKLDPIIDNDGGGHFMPDLTSTDVAFPALGGFAVGILLTLAFRAMFRNRGPIER
jgi:hypothetical protein